MLDLENEIGRFVSNFNVYRVSCVSPFPLVLSLSGSSRMTKEWGNSDRDPLKLNLKVWLSRLRSFEKLFLLGGGAMPRPLSSAWGDIRRSARLSTSSVASICSVMVTPSWVVITAAEYLTLTKFQCLSNKAGSNFTTSYHKFLNFSCHCFNISSLSSLGFG